MYVQEIVYSCTSHIVDTIWFVNQLKWLAGVYSLN